MDTKKADYTHQKKYLYQTGFVDKYRFRLLRIKGRTIVQVTDTEPR